MPLTTAVGRDTVAVGANRANSYVDFTRKMLTSIVNQLP